MAVSIGHKLRALKESLYPSLRFQVLAPALTVDQVRELGLPSTPLKETELRAAGWRDRYGIEQTEIDALATLRPGVLRQIVRDAAAPYFDATLDDRVADAESEWKIEAASLLEQALSENSEFATLRQQVLDGIRSSRAGVARLRSIVSGIRISWPGAAPVLPELGEIPAPLVSSDMPLLDAIRVLKARKNYAGNGTPDMGGARDG
jgi:hypothetical protein